MGARVLLTIVDETTITARDDLPAHAIALVSADITSVVEPAQVRWVVIKKQKRRKKKIRKKKEREKEREKRETLGEWLERRKNTWSVAPRRDTMTITMMYIDTTQV